MFVTRSLLMAIFLCIVLIPGRSGADTVQVAPDMPKLKTNQEQIEAVLRRSDLKIENIQAVFESVFISLPDRVKVYPTENYYYFRFQHNGVDFAGNFRLDVGKRDEGIIYFSYFKAFTGWQRNAFDRFKPFAAKDGVIVSRESELSYAVSFKGKTVIFDLNNLWKVKPPKGLLHDKEIYIGPVFDESGIQFFLVYNTKQKFFHYVLNETGYVPDEIYTSKISKHIVIGRRTGFAYYKDKYIDRKILIGVYKISGDVNDYLDGPFDHLPDNFLKGDQLKNAILEIKPELKGEIDRFGIYPGGDERYLIAPYLYYNYVEELMVFENCATAKETTVKNYYECFVMVETDPSDVADKGTNPELGEPVDPANNKTVPAK